MCGIAGFIDSRRATGQQALESRVTAMAAALTHRGPDADGCFAAPESGLALGFRRLSIQDLSAAGDQPMHSADGRYVIIFNGEIYNFRELRQELDAQQPGQWRGGSDTEVLLAAISRDGLARTLPRLDGMFAFALWDRQVRTLTLARDPVGEKPLYYGWSGATFLFGSELKALTCHPDWRADIDSDAVAAYLQYSYIPAPHSIYTGISKLPPGHCLTLPVDGLQPGSLPVPEPFWNARAAAEVAARNPFTGDDREAADELERLLQRSVARRMIADVPIGAYLSGGIDSPLIAALAQAVSDHPLQTFTIGFDDPRLDESEHAARIAAHLGTEHTELRAETGSVLELVERMPVMFDEPFGDVSQLPTLLLATLARQHVTTVLTGDGGDELFAGYPRYQSVARHWPKNALSQSLSGAIRDWAPCAALNRIGASSNRPPRLGDKLYRMLEDAAAASPERIHEAHMSRWRTARKPATGNRIGYFADPNAAPVLDDTVDRAGFADFMTYLPDDLLVKVDRTTMGVSLESRIPILAPDVVRFAWSLPPTMKIRNGQTKWLLRQVLHRHVPESLVDRPKQGFEPPVGEWLRGPLRDWAEDLLTPARLEESGLDPAPVTAAWREHSNGARDWRFALWNVLMLQAWRAAS